MVTHKPRKKTYPLVRHTQDSLVQLVVLLYTQTVVQATGGSLMDAVSNLSQMIILFHPTGGMMYQYFIKVVPTIYHKLSGEVSQSLINYCVHSSTMMTLTLTPAVEDQPVLSH